MDKMARRANQVVTKLQAKKEKEMERIKEWIKHFVSSFLAIHPSLPLLSSSSIRSPCCHLQSPLIQAHFLKLSLEIKASNGVRKVCTFNFKKGASKRLVGESQNLLRKVISCSSCFNIGTNIILAWFRC